MTETLTPEIRPKLALRPTALRRTVLKMAQSGQSVHVACAFSLIEIVATLYSKFVRLPSKHLNSEERDIVALSKGHGVMALYAALYEMGLIEQEHIDNYFTDGSSLKGLSSTHSPGIEVSGGSLGHGLAVSVGLALGAKLKGISKRIYCIVGDGEMNEGSMWEALLFAAHHKLSNLVLIVDANQFQAMGRAEDILNCEPFLEKFRAFNFQAAEIDGHNMGLIESTLNSLLLSNDSRPKAIVARTVKGKGVSFMESDNRWHYTRLDEVTFESAMKELQ